MDNDRQELNNVEQEHRWLVQNRRALEAYNVRVAKHGLLSDHARLLTTSPPPDRRHPKPR